MAMEQKLQDLEKETQAIQERNARVEVDKAWETSRFRIASVMCVTYIIAVSVMYLISAENIFRNALVPTVGYLLSTQSLPALKKWWIKKYFHTP